jgi:hypothetical protein
MLCANLTRLFISLALSCKQTDAMIFSSEFTYLRYLIFVIYNFIYTQRRYICNF